MIGVDPAVLLVAIIGAMYVGGFFLTQGLFSAEEDDRDARIAVFLFSAVWPLTVCVVLVEAIRRSSRKNKP